MKLTVVGGTGLIGSQVAQKLTVARHQAVSRSCPGLDLIRGQGLDQALEGAEVVVKVANRPTFDKASVGFFGTSMNNLLAAGDVPVSGTRRSSRSSGWTKLSRRRRCMRVLCRCQAPG